MKKRMISLSLVIVMLLSVTAQAATQALLVTPVFSLMAKLQTAV